MKERLRTEWSKLDYVKLWQAFVSGVVNRFGWFLVPIESPYQAICDFLLVFNINLYSMSHHFQVIADYWSNLLFRQNGRLPVFNALVQCEPLNPGSRNLTLKILEESVYRMVMINWQTIVWFCHETRVWQTDRRTDRKAIERVKLRAKNQFDLYHNNVVHKCYTDSRRDRQIECSFYIAYAASRRAGKTNRVTYAFWSAPATPKNIDHA